MRIAKNSIVSIEYRLTTDAGQLLDSATREEPLEYVHGAAGILPALERALTGKGAGDAFDVTITPDIGFGERQARLIEVLPRSQLGGNAAQISIGATVERTDPAGEKKAFVITAVDGDVVTLDGNHPLAGKVLRFQGSVLEVREATAEELTSH